MSSLKNYKLAAKRAVEQQQVVADLNALVKDIEGCENTIGNLKMELEAVNLKHRGRKTTRDDIAYLNDLLKCANKKLTWEKHIASLQKRTPVILQTMVTLINDPDAPPNDQTRAGMLQALQSVQAAMERLQQAKVS
jgi:hypothetical protein